MHRGPRAILTNSDSARLNAQATNPGVHPRPLPASPLWAHPGPTALSPTWHPLPLPCPSSCSCPLLPALQHTASLRGSHPHSPDPFWPLLLWAWWAPPPPYTPLSSRHPRAHPSRPFPGRPNLTGCLGTELAGRPPRLCAHVILPSPQPEGCVGGSNPTPRVTDKDTGAPGLDVCPR